MKGHNMIQIKNITTGEMFDVSPTKFPDGTSQVWKLQIDKLQNSMVDIVWYFEQEAELIWVNQLIVLLNQQGIRIRQLYIPYLPYGRQDKEVSNETTFAKTVFLEMLLTEMVGDVTTLDAHSRHAKVMSYSSYRYIKKAMDEFQPDLVVFPDKGASFRYSNIVGDNFLVLDKTRDQLTGEITGLEFNDVVKAMYHLESVKTNTVRILIVDDICDGGATFNNASIFLHAVLNKTGRKAKIGLYVTHGIFSKGYEKMIDSGISEFYTTQSLLKNVNGYELEEI